MSRKQRPINLPAPYLKRIWLDEARVTDRTAYPSCLPLFRSGFAFDFEKPITIIVSENGTGKSTLLDGWLRRCRRRQVLFLRLLRRMEHQGRCQVIMATHAPVLMAYPTAQLLLLSKNNLVSTTVEQTEHFKLT